MSTIFGMCSFTGKPTNLGELATLASATVCWASENGACCSNNQVGMGFHPYVTHLHCVLDIQPLADGLGNLLAFDGRLDNHVDLSTVLDLQHSSVADSLIVLAAFRRWGEECFSRFVGDWSLALWSHQDGSLYLARDHAGTRTLYYHRDRGDGVWSTYLDTFFVNGKTRPLNQDYALGYLAGQPLRNLTPYQGIQAVLPGHYLRFRAEDSVLRPHWAWMIQDRIHYSSVRLYEEHFLELFGRAVERRARPDEPIIAELSGGMDSTSIVCISDKQRLLGGLPPERLLDTLSFFDDRELTWNETPYFSAVERLRGKRGIHVDLSRMASTYEPVSLSRGLPLLPGADTGALAYQYEIDDLLGDAHRIVLSGIGGDELLGGVPSGLPELADFLISGNLRSLLRRSIEWSLLDRSPLISTLSETAKFAHSLYRPVEPVKWPEWITDLGPHGRSDTRLKRIGLGMRRWMRPSTIDNGMTWWALLETLPHLFPAHGRRREYRYPYLDRDLVEFLFRLPRQVLLAPGRRRSLMRSALKGTVPTEVLERRRKAYVSRRPISSVQRHHEKIDNLLMESHLEQYGLANGKLMRSALSSVVEGRCPHLWPPLARSISLELWLRSTPTVLSQ